MKASSGMFTWILLHSLHMLNYQESSRSRDAGQWKRTREDDRPTWVACKWSYSCTKTWTECAKKHCQSCRAAFAGLYMCRYRPPHPGLPDSCKTSSGCTAISTRRRGSWLHRTAARPTSSCDILRAKEMTVMRYTSFWHSRKIHEVVDIVVILVSVHGK